MGSARFIFPLRGKTAAQQPVGGQWLSLEFPLWRSDFPYVYSPLKN